MAHLIFQYAQMMCRHAVSSAPRKKKKTLQMSPILIKQQHCHSFGIAKPLKYSRHDEIVRTQIDEGLQSASKDFMVQDFIFKFL